MLVASTKGDMLVKLNVYLYYLINFRHPFFLIFSTLFAIPQILPRLHAPVVGSHKSPGGQCSHPDGVF